MRPAFGSEPSLPPLKAYSTVSVAAWAETVAAKLPASTEAPMRVENSDIAIPHFAASRPIRPPSMSIVARSIDVTAITRVTGCDETVMTITS